MRLLNFVKSLCYDISCVLKGQHACLLIRVVFYVVCIVNRLDYIYCLRR